MRRHPRLLSLPLVISLAAVVGSCAGGDDGSTTTAATSEAESASTDAPTTTVAPSQSAALLESVCSGAPSIVDAGTITSTEITEASGLAASRLNPATWWINNDSGDSARIFAIGDTAELLATVKLNGADARDWEDIAVGPPTEDGAATVYVGDTGDNSVIQDPEGGRGSIRVYRFAEPLVDRGEAPIETSVEVDTLTYEFPDGALDVEALLVDPVDGDLLVVTKDWQRTGAASVFRGDAAAEDGSTTELELVGSVPLEPGTLVTAADVTRDGSLVALRSYGAVHLYERPAGEPLWSAFETTPCEGPVPTEQQGESLGFAPDGGSYLTVSEGEQQTLHRTTP